jgi:predicted ATP-dependent protease
MKTTETLQGDRAATSSRPPRRSAHLVVAFVCEQPLLGTSRHDLAEIDEITIGRGHAIHVERAGRRLVVRIPDPWMSATHATVTRSLGRYILRDAASRNGTHVNAEPCDTAVLTDGDVIEVGHTFLLFRDAVKNHEGAPADLFAADPPAAGMATLVPSFANDLVLAQRVAASPVSVVMQAESGTGKELLARAIHTLSGRTGPFVAINCGAIPASLLETELFGHRKGAFSGALDDRPGLVRASDKGTLLLDEIGDLPLASQAAFLRVLQEREVLPIGAVRAVPVDLRLVAATHRRLEDLVAEGKFRADLLARISGYTLRIPPLRDRREDMGILVASLLARYAPSPETVTFTPDAARAPSPRVAAQRPRAREVSRDRARPG